jgi:hypothetical protein
LFPSTTTTRVSSAWVASMSIFLGMCSNCTAAPRAPLGARETVRQVSVRGDDRGARARGALRLCCHSRSCRARHRGSTTPAPWGQFHSGPVGPIQHPARAMARQRASVRSPFRGPIGLLPPTDCIFSALRRGSETANLSRRLRAIAPNPPTSHSKASRAQNTMAIFRGAGIAALACCLSGFQARSPCDHA